MREGRKKERGERENREIVSFKYLIIGLNRNRDLEIMGGSSGGGASYRSGGDSDVEEDYEVDDFGDEVVESRGNRFNPLNNFLGLDFAGGNGGKFTVINGIRDISRGSIVHPDNR